MNISTKSQTINIQTDNDACYTVEIISSTGNLVYKGNIWSKNHHISISGLELGNYTVSILLMAEKHEEQIAIQ